MKTEHRKNYEKRRNIWRHNVPKVISKFKRVPVWFEDMGSFRKILRKRTSGKAKYIETTWFSRLKDFIKNIFRGKSHNK